MLADNLKTIENKKQEIKIMKFLNKIEKAIIQNKNKEDLELFMKTKDKLSKILSIEKKEYKVIFTNKTIHKIKAVKQNEEFKNCQVPKNCNNYSSGISDFFLNGDLFVLLVLDKEKIIGRMVARRMKSHRKKGYNFYLIDRIYTNEGVASNMKYKIQAEIIFKLNTILNKKRYIALHSSTRHDNKTVLNCFKSNFAENKYSFLKKEPFFNFPIPIRYYQRSNKFFINSRI
jgi:hypothetical protein